MDFFSTSFPFAFLFFLHCCYITLAARFYTPLNFLIFTSLSFSLTICCIKTLPAVGQESNLHTVRKSRLIENDGIPARQTIFAVYPYRTAE